MTSTIELRNTLTLDYEVGPFISLFVSFNEISNKNEYLNLIDNIKEAFTTKHDETIWPRYERKLRRFNFDRAKHIGNGSGIAIYVSFKAIHSFDLAQPVKTQISIEDTMNISQLVKEIQSQLHYHILALFDNDFKVFRVDNGTFSVINTANKPLSVLVDNDKEKYYRLVDEYVKELLGDDNYLPVAIVANDQNRQLFTQLSSINNLSKDISYNYDDKNIAAEKLNDIIDHFNQSFLNKMSEDNTIKYESASSKHQVATDLRDIISNAISGKIDTLYINEAAYNKTLNDLAITTIGFAGEVIILPKKQMPMHLDVAAITLKF